MEKFFTFHFSSYEKSFMIDTQEFDSIFKMKITKINKFTRCMTNEIISILVNSLTFIIFTSFEDTESIPDSVV